MESEGIVYLYRIPALLLAVTVHEFMHGMAAYKLGDSTARDQGRLTLNPIKHLDVIGTLMLIIAGFGWAKPVPVNPHRFKNPTRDMMIVGLAGPAANFVAAYILARLFMFSMPELFVYFLLVTVQLNIMLGVFNLIPIPPLDGSKVVPYFLPASMRQAWWRFEQYGFVVLLALVFLLSGFLSTIIQYPANLVEGLVYVGTPFHGRL